MSFGFIRKQSTASSAAARRSDGARRYRQLTKLKIDEVSSVDAGANPGARVVFAKSGSQTPRDTMPTTSQIIAKAAKLRADGEISDFSNALLHQVFAKQRFPDAQSTAEALSRWYSTVEGAEALRSSVAKNFEDMQKRSACGDAYDVIVKRGTVPRARAAWPDGGGDTDTGVDGFEDHPDFKTACHRMKALRPDLSPQAVADAVYSFRHRKEVEQKRRAMSS